MKAPQITGAKESEILEKDPPPRERSKAHKWLSQKNKELFTESEKTGFGLYLSKMAEEKIRNHALSQVEKHREVMGLMLGSIFKSKGREYALARDVVTTELNASAVRVSFDRSYFEELFDKLDQAGFNYIIVGWYHSHPGYGCFMSSTDVQTQRTMFNKSYHSAIVIDPVQKEIEAFYLKEGRIETRPFTVYWDEHQTPYFGTSVKFRQLRSDPDGVPLS